MPDAAVAVDVLPAAPRGAMRLGRSRMLFLVKATYANEANDEIGWPQSEGQPIRLCGYQHCSSFELQV